MADKALQAGLLPPAGTMRRYRVLEWLSFVSAELHRGYTPLFDGTLSDAYRAKVSERLARRFDIVEQHLSDRRYLMGNAFTVVDAYCFTILNWANYVDVDMSPWQNIETYQLRVAAWPSVQRAMKAEGLIE